MVTEKCLCRTCYPSLKPETMPLNQGVKKKLAIVTAASGIICKHSNVWSFDCESEKEKKKYMNENSIFNFSCLKLISSIIKHPEKKFYALLSFVVEYKFAI